jgi:hypothetical protein
MPTGTQIKSSQRLKRTLKWGSAKFGKAKLQFLSGMMAVLLACFVGVTYSSGHARGRANFDRGERSEGISNAAIEKFWAIYHGNDYDAIPETQEQLENAIRRDPDNPTLYALLGATHFWHVGELTRDSKPDQSVLAQDMPTAAGLFQKALDLDYYSPQAMGYINDDHLPGYLGITTVHTGQQYGDQSLIAKGDQLLDFAVYEFPEFNNFNRWAAYNTEPRDSATYQRGLDSKWQAIDACIGTPIDRTNPDMKPYLQLVTAVGRKKVCWWRGDIAPYGFEGLILNLANGLVKAGQVDAAKVMYANARYADNYATWPYRDVLETIAASDLNARAALCAGCGPKSAPPLSVPNRSCVYCHATVAELGSR